MNYIRPKRIIAKKGSFQAAFELTHSHEYEFQENGITISKTMQILYQSVPITPYKSQIPNIRKLTPELIEKYHSFKHLINHCNNIAEELNTSLREFMLTIKGRKESRNEILSKDFMGLRGMFSDFLNGYTEIKQEEKFNKKDKRKVITKTMNYYILDRNILTHGTLKLKQPNGIFLMEYIEEKKAKVYAELNEEILKSNIDTGTELKKIIREIRAFYNKK